MLELMQGYLLIGRQASSASQGCKGGTMLTLWHTQTISEAVMLSQDYYGHTFHV